MAGGGVWVSFIFSTTFWAAVVGGESRAARQNRMVYLWVGITASPLVFLVRVSRGHPKISQSFPKDPRWGENGDKTNAHQHQIPTSYVLRSFPIRINNIRLNLEVEPYKTGDDPVEQHGPTMSEMYVVKAGQLTFLLPSPPSGDPLLEAAAASSACLLFFCHSRNQTSACRTWAAPTLRQNKVPHTAVVRYRVSKGVNVSQRYSSGDGQPRSSNCREKASKLRQSVLATQNRPTLQIVRVSLGKIRAEAVKYVKSAYADFFRVPFPELLQRAAARWYR